MRIHLGLAFSLMIAAASSGAEQLSYSQGQLPLSEGKPSQKIRDLREGTGWNAACCKVCRKGKACGNSCIKRTYTCHKGKGCACDGQASSLFGIESQGWDW